MTTTIAELCGHCWPSPARSHGDVPSRTHRCERPAQHQRDMMLRQPQQCRCRCGATTTRPEGAAQ